MQLKDRQKMCTSCDGRVALDAEVCPYCAADLSSVSHAAEPAKELHHRSLQDSLSAPYTPPYAVKGTGPVPLPGEAPPTRKPEPSKESMADKRFNNPNMALGVPTIPADSMAPEQTEGERGSFWPILLLSLGGNLLVIGLLQLLFSDNGFLRLEWDSSYWFFYCLAAAPLFFFGFKKAGSVKG